MVIVQIARETTFSYLVGAKKQSENSEMMF